MGGTVVRVVVGLGCKKLHDLVQGQDLEAHHRASTAHASVPSGVAADSAPRQIGLRSPERRANLRLPERRTSGRTPAPVARRHHAKRKISDERRRARVAVVTICAARRAAAVKLASGPRGVLVAHGTADARSAPLAAGSTDPRIAWSRRDAGGSIPSSIRRVASSSSSRSYETQLHARAANAQQSAIAPPRSAARAATAQS
mmetsp:Transcript_24136/g.72538  ORF Transcript_24136/g.72538 Transcript_24136/m.72538 type:complete len:201 (+) Transcript_24136:249-851(+)